MDTIKVRRAGPGRPRTRPDHILGDKGYSFRKIRAHLRKRGIGHTIPERRDQRTHRSRRGRVGGRPRAFDKQLYKKRNVVERCFNRLKQYRAIATRYDKTQESYQAAVTIASLLLWLNPLRRHRLVPPGWSRLWSMTGGCVTTTPGWTVDSSWDGEGFTRVRICGLLPARW